MTDNSTRTDLFAPVTLGTLDLANRIVMAPLTRSRASDDGVVGKLQATYYAQRPRPALSSRRRPTSPLRGAAMR